ncbi:hypothetical protein D9M71_601010 [compost metagenome]
MFYGLLYPDRPRAGGHDQRPDQQIEQQLPTPAAGTGAARLLADGATHGGKERYPQRTVCFPISAQVAISQPGQR